MDNVFKVISEQGIEALGRYYSVYEGIVLDRVDKTGCGQLKVVCADILGGVTFWAKPLMQYGGANNGFKMIAPQNGDLVYILFQDGDLSNPLWLYHGYSINKADSLLANPDVAGIKTQRGNLFLIHDVLGTLSANFKGDMVLYSGGNTDIRSKGTLHIDGVQGNVLGDGSNEGLVIIGKLTEKLNQLVKEIEAIKAQINSHVHPSSSGPTGTPMVPINQTISTFVQSDYEDTHTIH